LEKEISRLKTRTVAFVVVLVVAFAGSAYYYSESFVTTNPSAKSLTVDIQIVGGVGANTTDTYDPDNFTVIQGYSVTLVVLNTDDNTHGLVIPEFHVDTGIIPSGNTVKVSFTPNVTGTFQFYEPPGYCTGGVGNACNSVQKMSGTMTVIP
jgi:heme/copper-type cytochrome/quinol oxidase subunit 2